MNHNLVKPKISDLLERKNVTCMWHLLMFNEIENESHQDSSSMINRKTPVAFKGTPNIPEQDIQPRYLFAIENEWMAKDCVIDDKINNRNHNGKRKQLAE